MGLGRDKIGVIYINPYSFVTASGVSAPTTVTIHKTDGGTAAQFTMTAIEFSRGRATALGTLAVANNDDVDFGSSIAGRNPNAFSLSAYSGDSGDSATSWAWGFAEDGSSGNTSSLSAGTTDTEDYEDQAFVILSGEASFTLSLTGTNSGGSTAATDIDFNITGL